MTALRKILGKLVLTSALGVASAAANAAVLFTITGLSFTPGSGYGVDSSETSGPTLLDVAFGAGAAPGAFSLNLPSPSSNSFLFGTVDLKEPDAGGGIDTAETDDLGVQASFVFTTPSGTTQILTATGTAFTGSVSDGGSSPGAVDYTLTWTPIFVSFGAGGQFKIELADLSFSNQVSQNLNATVTLLALPQTTEPPGAQIPEPTSLALVSLGLLAAGTAASRRKNAA